MMLGHWYSRSMTSVVDDSGHEAEQRRIRVLSASRPRWSVSGTWSGIGAPARWLRRSRDPPLGPDERHRDAAPTTGRLECGDGAGRDDVDRLGETRCAAAATNARAASVLDHGEGRVGEHAERHRRHAQEATERARNVRPEHGGEPHGTDRDAHPLADLRSGVFDVGDHAAVLAGGLEGRPRRAA